MKCSLKIVFTLVLLINCLIGRAGKQQDSLLILFKSANIDSLKIKYLHSLIFWQISDGDYAAAERNLDFFLELAKKKYNLKNYLDYYNNQGILNRAKGNLAMSLFYYKKGLLLTEKCNDSSKIATICHNIGRIYVKQGDLNQGLSYLLRSAALKEKLGQKKRYANSLGEIGSIFSSQQNPVCLEYFYKALTIERETNNLPGIAIVLNSIGDYYKSNKDSSFKYYSESIKINQQVNYLPALAHSYNKIGFLTLSSDPLRSFTYFEKCKELNDSLKNYEGLSDAHNGIGNYYLLKKEYDKARLNFIEQLNYAKKSNVLNKISEAYFNLYKVFKLLNQVTASLENFEKYTELKDSIYNEGITRKLLQNELNFKYKKQKELDDLKSQKKEEVLKLDLKHQKQLKYFFVIVIAIVFVFALFTYRAYVSKKRSNEELAEKNKIINNQKMQVEEQKEELQIKQTAILDSIRYAKRIQDSLLPTHNYIDKSIKKK